MEPLWQRIKSIRLPQKAPALRKRSDLHLARKAFHMSGAFTLLVPFLALGVSKETMAAGLGTALALSMSLEYSRSRFEWVNGWTVKFMGPLMRESELNQLSGIPFYLASCLFAFLIFPKHIAVLAILHLAVGDPMSSFFGVLYGRNKLFPNKSLQGTLGGFFVCALVSLGYLFWIEIPRDRLLLLSLLGGFSGALAELLPLNIDDNFSIPVISGFLLWAAFWAANIPPF